MATSKPTRTTPQQQEQIRTAYQAGTSMERIAEAFGIGVASVHRILKKLGVQSRSNLKPIETGTRFGSLTIVRYLGKSLWLCLCDCGTEEKAGATALRKGVHVRCVRCRIPEAPPEHKTCTSCGTEYPNTAEFFTRSNQFRFGLKAKCKKCFQPEIRDNGARTRRSLRMEVLSHYSGGKTPQCACCGESTYEFLSLDHLEGGGRQEHKKYAGGTKFLANVKREGFILKAQVLCHNCNNSIAHHGSCPHRPEIVRPIKLRKTVEPLTLPAGYAGPSQACVRCHAVFPVAEDYYHRNHRMRSGFTTVCRACANSERSKNGIVSRAKQRLEVLSHYSRGKMLCECCKCNIVQFLTIDHIGGGGMQHRKAIDEPLYRHLHKNGFPEDIPLRVLCFNCNMASGFYGSCPHQR